MREDYDRFRAAGGEVAVLTMGSPPQVAAYRERWQLPFPCLSDPQREAYRVFGVPMGSITQIAGPGTWTAGLKAIAKTGIGIPRGNPYQLHAAFVVDTRGQIQFVHLPRNSADLPSHEGIIQALAQEQSRSGAGVRDWEPNRWSRA